MPRLGPSRPEVAPVSVEAVRIYYCDHFVLPLPPGHRFPMEKYSLLRSRVASEAPRLGATLHVPAAATDRDLERVHTAEYVRAVTTGSLTSDEIRRIGFPWSEGLVERSRRSVGGTMCAALDALGDGVAVNLAGGTHHASRASGEGFCVFNDVAVAIAAVRASTAVRRVAVVDLDVHQGNGTAAMFAEDAQVFTASVHGSSNFPFRKTEGDLDIGLPDGTGDVAYLGAVRTAVEAAITGWRPELVFYVAGADAFAGDRLGRLSVSKAALAVRDRTVIDACVAVGAPLALVMAGGYASPVSDTVDIHLRSVVTVLEGGRRYARSGGAGTAEAGR